MKKTLTRIGLCLALVCAGIQTTSAVLSAWRAQSQEQPQAEQPSGLAAAATVSQPALAAADPSDWKPGDDITEQLPWKAYDAADEDPENPAWQGFSYGGSGEWEFRPAGTEQGELVTEGNGNTNTNFWCWGLYNGGKCNIYQEFEIPAGVYTLSVQGCYRQGMISEAFEQFVSGTQNDNCFIYANVGGNVSQSPLRNIFNATVTEPQTAFNSWMADNQSEYDGTSYYIPACHSAADVYIENGLMSGNEVLFTVPEKMTIRVGISKPTAVSQDQIWWNHWRIIYEGEYSAESEALVAAKHFNELKEQAEDFTFSVSEKFPALGALMYDEISEVEIEDYKNIDSVNKAIELIMAVDDNIRAVYPKALALDKSLDACKGMLKVTDYAGKAAMQSAIDKAASLLYADKLDASVTTNSYLDAADALNKARIEYLLTQTPAEDGSYDFTHALNYPWFVNQENTPTLVNGTWQFPANVTDAFNAVDEGADSNLENGIGRHDGINVTFEAVSSKAGWSTEDTEYQWVYIDKWNGWHGGMSYCIQKLKGYAGINSDWSTGCNPGYMRVYQTIDNLPDGYYTLEGRVWHNCNITDGDYTWDKANDNYMYIEDANGNQLAKAMQVNESASYWNGWSTDMYTTLTTKPTYITGGKVTLGYNNNCWFLNAGMTLKYYGESIDYNDIVTNKIAEATPAEGELWPGDVTTLNAMLDQIVLPIESADAFANALDIISEATEFKNMASNAASQFSPDMYLNMDIHYDGCDENELAEREEILSQAWKATKDLGKGEKDSYEDALAARNIYEAYYSYIYCHDLGSIEYYYTTEAMANLLSKQNAYLKGIYASPAVLYLMRDEISGLVDRIDSEKYYDEKWISLVNNGDCEGEDFSNFVMKNYGETTVKNPEVVESDFEYLGKVLSVSSTDRESDSWDNLFWITLPDTALAKGDKVKISFKLRADKSALVNTQCHAAPGEYLHWSAIGYVYFSTEWNTYTTTATIQQDNTSSIAFLLNEYDEANTYYFDDIRWEVLYEPEKLKDGDYYIKNVATGKYLNGGASWGTKAVLRNDGQLMTVKMSNGQYTIDTHFSNGGTYYHYLSGDEYPYVDSYITYHNIINQGDGTYAIKYDGRYLTADDDDQANFTADKVTDNAKWQFVTRDEFVKSLEAATMNAPIDATSLIYDPGFGRNNMYFNEWQGESVSKGGLNDNFVAEKWYSSPFESYQTLKVPNGLYKISANGFFRDGNIYEALGRNCAYLFANDEEVMLKHAMDETEILIAGNTPDNMSQASSAFLAGAYLNELEVVVEDSTLTFGIKKTDAYDNDWTCWDNFQLTYYGPYTFSDDDYRNSCPTATYKRTADGARVTLKYKLPNTTLYYSIDGGEAVEYTEPFMVDETCDIVAWGINDNGIETKKCEALHISFDYIEVNVKTPGSFARLLLDQVESFDDVTLLRVTGRLNDNDIAYISGRLDNIVGLDLSGVKMTEMPSEMLRDKQSLIVLKLPETLENIGSYAMYNCPQLGEIELPEPLRTVGSYAFANCQNLTKVKWNDKLEYIYNEAFEYTRIAEFTAPESLKRIEWGAFRNNSSLAKVDLSNSSVEDIGGYAFENCGKLKEVTLNEGLSRINYSSFRYCPTLTSIELPSTLSNIDYPFYGCENLKTIVCKAVAMPETNGNDLFSSTYYSSQATLYVPAIVLNAYKNQYPWSNFGEILPIEGYEPENIIVRGTLNLDTDMAILNRPAVSVEVNNWNTSYQGHMTVNCDTLSMSEFQIIADDQQSTKYMTWGNSSNDSKYNSYATLINNGPVMRADSVVVTDNMYSNYWTFLCLPFNVNISDIKVSPAETQWVVRKYNGANRAAGVGNTWENVPANATIAAGEGFIVQNNGNNFWDRDYATFSFPAINDGKKNAIFTNGDATVELNDYSGDDVFAHNRSWNLIGNPYPAYYDLRFCDFTAPVTVWLGYRYEAFSPVDDEYVLHPFEAMFVQRPVDQAVITFSAEGRQHEIWPRDIEQAPRRANLRDVQREVFNLTLSNGERTDRTRFVFNSSAQLGYEIECDAAKFFSTDNSGFDLYTIEGGVQMAINERPAADGVVKLGMRIGTAGQYTIAMTTKSAADIVLVDLATGTETSLADGNSYTFECAAGTIADRFEVRFAADETEATGIGSTAADGDAQYYTTGGIALPGKPATPGVYMQKRGGVVRKVVVK